MSVASPAVESVPIRPVAGCGTLKSPWTGWEHQIEDQAVERTYAFHPGFYGVSRPVRLGPGTTVETRPRRDGRAWFLPHPPEGQRLETLFLVDGAHAVTISGVCLNGGDVLAKAGIRIRCGTRIHIEDCRFGDFGAPDGAALEVIGESEDRCIREVILKSCRFVNGSFGVHLGAHISDLLVTDNRFEEIAGPATLVDPADRWSDYGLIFVKNRLLATSDEWRGPFVRILPGAEGIRLAENTLDGPASVPGPTKRSNSDGAGAGVEVRGGGPVSTRRLEIILNRIHGTTGPGITGIQCGPGFLAAGNHLESCGNSDRGAVDLVDCHGILVEDNEVNVPPGPGIRLRDCSGSRLNGNEVNGCSDLSPARGGSIGVLVDGSTSRRVRVTDNRVSGIREQGVQVSASVGVRVVGNEVQDCGEGIRIAAATNLLLVGNDCRDNGRSGIQIDREVHRGLVALNYAILNGSRDLEVLGNRIRCHSNKVDRQGNVPENDAGGEFGRHASAPSADSGLDPEPDLV